MGEILLLAAIRRSCAVCFAAHHSSDSCKPMWPIVRFVFPSAQIGVISVVSGRVCLLIHGSSRQSAASFCSPVFISVLSASSVVRFNWMISFSNINKQYGKQLVFVDASFQLNPGEKVGLVGPNGAGKTTLFRMVVGEEEPDEGEVSVPKRLTIGYFRQDVEEMSGRSVLDEAIAGSGRVGLLHHELEALQHAMGDPAQADDMDRILARFGEVQEEYEHLGGYALESQAREVLHGLGFEDEQIDGDVGALSGGWKMRVAVARVLLGRPDVLLMDEPTNHLDLESIIWLEQFLKSYPGALLMTSHDREFMN